MRIEEHKPSIESGGVFSYEKTFSIGNVGRIMTILRNSMYSNPIKAIAREITCNARDAHREIGSPDRPIEVHLPNSIDNNYSIKDYGPGISPERMEHVFIAYGTSTKNEDDLQTGGFGLGAKTPFAYSDQFRILTTTKENNVNIKRTYIAYIDESSAGKMRLISQEETKEETGTEISLVVNSYDFAKFADATISVCEHWDVLPILKGSNLPKWPEKKEPILILNNNWGIYHKDYYDKAYAIIDGIAYQLNYESVMGKSKINYYNDSIYSLFNSNILLHFKNGELSLSANREELQYNEKTKKNINDRINQLLSEVSNLVSEKIKTAKTYSEAVYSYYSIAQNIGFIIPNNLPPEWNGVKILNSVKLNTGTRTDLKQEYSASIFSKNFDGKRVSRSKISTLDFAPNPPTVLINDLYENSISESRIRFFLQNLKIKPNYNNSVVIFSFAGLKIKEGIEQIKEDTKFDIDLLNPIMMSSIIVPLSERKRRLSLLKSRSLAKAFEYDISYLGNRKCDNYWKPTEIDIKNDTGIYVISSGQNNIITITTDNDSSPVDVSYISYANHYINKGKDKDDYTKIYAIRSRDIEKIGPGWVSLNKFLLEKINKELLAVNLTIEDLYKTYMQKDFTFELWKKHQTYYGKGILDNIAANINESFLIKKYYNESIEITKKIEKYKDIIILIKNKKFVLQKEDLPLFILMNNVEEKYPLLSNINWGSVSEKQVLDYISLIEKS